MIEHIIFYKILIIYLNYRHKINFLIKFLSINNRAGKKLMT